MLTGKLVKFQKLQTFQKFQNRFPLKEIKIRAVKVRDTPVAERGSEVLRNAKL